MSKEIARAKRLKSYEDLGDRIVFTRKGFLEHPPQTYTVYRQATADAHGIDYVPWRVLVQEATASSEAMERWVLTDDGYVAQCFRVSKFLNKRGTWHTYMRFSFCKMFYSASATLSFENWAVYGSFNRVGIRDWYTIEQRSYKTKGFVSLYVAQIITGKRNMRDLAKAWRPNAMKPRETVMKMLRKESVQKMISEELVRVLADTQVDRDYVKGIFLEATEMARKTKNANAMIKAGEALMHLLDLRDRPDPNKVGEGGFDKKALEGIYEVLGVREEPKILPEKIEEKAFVEKGRKGRKND